MQCSLIEKDVPYKHWEFSDLESGDKLRVVPDRGGLITSWVSSGREIFYFDQSRFKDPSKSVRGGMPILFPICGDLSGNRFFIDKNEYCLSQHGFARDACWNLSLLEDEMGIRLSLKENNNTLASYPFHFNLDIDVKMTDQALSVISRVRNNSEYSMPFSFGLHPYFKVKDLSKIHLLNLPETVIDQKNMLREETVLQLCKLNQGVDFLFETNNSIKLIDKVDNFSLELKSEDPFLFNVIWTDPPREMICLEPWTSPRNSMLTGQNILTLLPKSLKEIKCQFLCKSLN